MRLTPPPLVDAPDATAPVGDGEFAALMGGLGPFPCHPRIAIGVSGGPDSLALALLIQRWADDRSGSLLAVTIDHGLRAEASAEAVETGRQLAGRGIDHQIATWRPGEPGAVGQAKAREARYRLLARVCRSRGYSTLLLAHHRGDQAETLLQRLEHGTGPMGLAAMAPVGLRRGIRVLRPLLAIPKARLEATCRAAGLVPVRDPTNENITHERPALRRLLAQGGEAAAQARVAAFARAAGRGRTAAGHLDAEAARASLGCIRPVSAGYAWLDAGRLAAVGPLAAERAVGLLVAAIGGAEYARGEGLEGFTAWLRSGAAEGRGKTFGRVYARRGRDERDRPSILVCREPANLQERGLGGSATPLWDDRFRIDLRPVGLPTGRLAALGAELGNEFKEIWACPSDVARTLPGLWLNGEIVALPQFSLHDRLEIAGSLATFDCTWCPRRTMTANAGDWALASGSAAGAPNLLDEAARLPDISVV